MADAVKGRKSTKDLGRLSPQVSSERVVLLAEQRLYKVQEPIFVASVSQCLSSPNMRFVSVGAGPGRRQRGTNRSLPCLYPRSLRHHLISDFQ